MDWVRLGVRYFLDPKIRGMDGDLADAAEVMFTRSVAWAGELKRDGFIPEQDVELLTRRRRHEAVVNVLVELGLWVAVPGGYRVVRWPDWNGDNIDALTRRRAADAERQRRRRERIRQSTTSLSRDMSRDVTVAEGEGELEGVHLGGLGTAPQANGAEPPRRCSRHLNDHDPPPCGPCRDARLAAEAWQREHTKTLAAANAAAAKQRVTTRRCPRCGTKHTGPCTQ